MLLNVNIIWTFRLGQAEQILISRINAAKHSLNRRIQTEDKLEYNHNYQGIIGDMGLWAVHMYKTSSSVICQNNTVDINLWTVRTKQQQL